MENIEKHDNRGIAVSRNWEEIRKSGGKALSIDTIERILQGEGDNTVLSREEVINRTKEYFNSCIGVVKNEETGELETVWTRNPTKSAYALALGINRYTLQCYLTEKQPDGKPYGITPRNRIIANENFDVLQRACSLIESFYEEKLAENRNVAGCIFWLNNTNNKAWSNNQEITVLTDKDTNSTMTMADLPKLNEYEIADLPELPELDNGNN